MSGQGLPSLREPAFGASADHADPPIFVRAIVVFCDSGDVPWLRWLRRGFRHCFAAIDDGKAWVTVDPLLHRLEVRATGLPSGFDLEAEYRRRGLTVIGATARPVRRRCAPIALFTCVETVKRLLGIRAWWIVTPWQLHCRLRRDAAVGKQGAAPAAVRPHARAWNKTRKYS